MRSAAVAAFRRAEVEAEIERLIAFLDITDGDADLEPTAANPGYLDECEPCDDTEPSLGSTASIDQNRAWKGHAAGGWHATYAVDGEQGDDTGIGDVMGLNFDDEESDHGGGDILDQPHDEEEDGGDSVDEPWFPYKEVRDRPAALAALMEARRLGAAVRIKETPHAVYQGGRRYTLGL